MSADDVEARQRRQEREGELVFLKWLVGEVSAALGEYEREAKREVEESAAVEGPDRRSLFLTDPATGARTKVAEYAATYAQGGYEVVDDEEFVAWVEQHYPGKVKKAVDSDFAKELLDSLQTMRDDDGEIAGIFDLRGNPVDGVVYTPPKKRVHSVRLNWTNRDLAGDLIRAHRERVYELANLPTPRAIEAPVVEEVE